MICTFDTVYSFQCATKLIIFITIASMNAKLTSHIFTLQKRERAALHMLETVYTLARLKIVPTIMNLYHIQ